MVCISCSKLLQAPRGSKPAQVGVENAESRDLKAHVGQEPEGTIDCIALEPLVIRARDFAPSDDRKSRSGCLYCIHR